MGKIKTIQNKSGISKIRYYPQFSAVCAIGEAPFYGTIEIMYKPCEVLLEFESFEDWLRENANTKTTIEDLARVVYDLLNTTLSPLSLSVTVNAQTTVHACVSATIESV